MLPMVIFCAQSPWGDIKALKHGNYHSPKLLRVSGINLGAIALAKVPRLKGDISPTH